MSHVFVVLPAVITALGVYRTRGGERVTVHTASWRRDRFACAGHYANGTPERWHCTGRLHTLQHVTSANDIVALEQAMGPTVTLGGSDVHVPALAFSVAAEAHSDDRVIEVEFDAAPWFRAASDDAILALARIGWGADYAADAVAEDLADRDAELRTLFAYLARVRDRRDAPGFECHVWEADARAWLAAFRPALAAALPA